MNLRLHRWRAPLLSQKQRIPALDEAARTLEQLARSVLGRVPSVLIDVIEASHSPVERRGYAETAQILDRAWRFKHLKCEIFCVLDEISQRKLLSFIVGGSKAGQLTGIECSIITESIARLLAGSSQIDQQALHEEPRIRPPAIAWRCNVDMCSRDRQTASLQLFTECQPPPPPAEVRGPNIRGVPLQLRATFPSVACALAEVSSWRRGTLLKLRQSERDVTTLLSATGRRVAIGQLGALRGERAVKLLEVCQTMVP